MAVVLVFGKWTAWKVPPGLNATQVVLWHILHFHFTLYEHYELYEKCYHTPLGKWSSVVRNPLYPADSEMLLGIEWC